MRDIRAVQFFRDRRDGVKPAAERPAVVEVMPLLGVQDEMPAFNHRILLSRGWSNSGMFFAEYGASGTPRCRLLKMALPRFELFGTRQRLGVCARGSPASRRFAGECQA